MSDDDPKETDAGLEPTAAGDDAVLPFQLDRLDLRGRVCRLDHTLDRILSQHRYPPSVCALIGEAALITALIGQAMKLRGRFSLQARGDGPVSLIATDYYAPEIEGGPARMRAYAQFDREATPATSDDPFSLVGSGLYGMTIDQGAHMAPYQGVTPLVSDGLAACAETYFAQSEQIATKFHLAIGQAASPGGEPHWRAGGVMLQHLGERGESAQIPDAPSGEEGLMTAQDVADMGDKADNWRRAVLLLDTAEEIELIGPHVTPERLLLRLFHQETPRVYPAQPVEFGCTCAREKVEAVLSQYSAESLHDMLDETGGVTADCQFCGAQYRFTPQELFGSTD